jgi:hypothetical protein
MCLVLAGEEDRVVGIPERVDATIRRRRNTDGLLADNGYGVSSFPSTSSYSRGTNAQTSCATNFT